MAARKKATATKATSRGARKSTGKSPSKKPVSRTAARKPKGKVAAPPTRKPRQPPQRVESSGAPSPRVVQFVPEVVILAAGRSALARAGRGALRDTRPENYAAAVIREVIKRSGVSPSALGDVVMGCAMPEAEQGMNVARSCALMARVPVDVPAMTLNRFCSSGLEAMASVTDRILARRYDVAVAGGMESMSLIPMGGQRPTPNPDLLAFMPQVYMTMGITAEHVARQFHVSRAEQDSFALRSHQRAVAAQDGGRFHDEIVPVHARVVEEEGKHRLAPFAIDEGPRRDTTQESLARLKPVYDAKGTVTAGNASPLTDGAAAVVLADADFARAQGLKPRAYVRGYTVVGVPPEIMGTGPVPAIRKLLGVAGLKIHDVDLFEINEAFASQAVYCQRELEIDPDKLNVNGGGISLGHPLGCTGARQVATLVHEMERRHARWGVVSMCVGGGMGAAALLERVQA